MHVQHSAINESTFVFYAIYFIEQYFLFENNSELIFALIVVKPKVCILKHLNLKSVDGI